jgi:hypothetical protein
MWKILGRARAFLSRVFQTEETEEDGELFDRELEIEDEESEVMDALEQSYADAEILIRTLEYEDEIEIEEEIPIFSYPDWVSDSTKNEIYENLGITDYEDLTDEEKNDYIPGWLGYENADEPADDDTRDEFEIMDEIANKLNIPADIAVEMELEELIQLSNIFDETIAIAREFEGLNPHKIAEDLDIDFLSSFSSWEDFLSSRIYQTFLEHPDWISTDVYFDEEGELEIDVYEVEDVSP